MCKKLHLLLLLAAFGTSRALMLAPAPYASDVPVYFAAAREWAGGRAPYRDVAFEYPPLAALVCYLPMLLGATDVGRYRAWFAVEMLVCDVVVLALLLRRRRGVAAGWWYLLLTALMQPLVFDRFDLVVGAALVVAVLERSQLAVVCGAFLKFVPLLASPLLFWYPERPLRDRARELLLRGALPLTAMLLGAWLWFGHGILSPIAYHASRGIQIESLWASVALLAQVAGATPMMVVDSHHAQHLTGGLADALLPWTLPINLLASGVAIVRVALVWRRRGPGAKPDLATGVAIVMLAFLATCRVLSPQFLLWLVAIVPLCLAGDGERSARRTFLVLMTLCVGLTSYLFRRLLWALVAMHEDVIALYVARNALLVAMLVVLLRSLGRKARAAM